MAPAVVLQAPSERVSAEVQLILPFEVLVDRRVFTVTFPDWNAAIWLERRKVEGARSKYRIDADGIELARDRWGFLRYSKATVRLPAVSEFGSNSVVSLADNQGMSHSARIVRRALTVVNRFIQVHRALSGEYHLRSLRESDLFGPYVASVDWYLDNAYRVSVTPVFFGAGLTGERLDPPEAFHVSLGERLTGGPDVPLHVDLQVTARDYLDQGELRFAVVDSRTALEVFVDRCLAEEMQARGVSVSQAKGVLGIDLRVKASSIEQVLSSARLGDKLKVGFRWAFGSSPADDSGLWRRWLRAKQVREEVVHYGGSPTLEQATNHLEVVDQIIAQFGGDMRSPHWKIQYVEKGTFTMPPFTPAEL